MGISSIGGVPLQDTIPTKLFLCFYLNLPINYDSEPVGCLIKSSDLSDFAVCAVMHFPVSNKNWYSHSKGII